MKQPPRSPETNPSFGIDGDRERHHPSWEVGILGDHPKAAIVGAEVITDSGSDSKAATPAITHSDPPPRPRANLSASACEPYRERIERAASHGRNAMSIWQDLVDDYGFSHSYQSVGRFVKKLRGERVVEAHPVIRDSVGRRGSDQLRRRRSWPAPS